MTPDQEEAALCQQVDPDLWYGENKGESCPDAKRVCRRCPVRLPCLITALEANEQWGVWGGFTEGARRKITVDTAADAILLDNAHAERKALRRAAQAEKHRARTAQNTARLRAHHDAYKNGKRDAPTRAGEAEYQRVLERYRASRAA